MSLNAQVSELTDTMVGRLAEYGIRSGWQAERLTIDRRNYVLDVAGWSNVEDVAWAATLATLPLFASVDEVRRCNIGAGFHFFDADTMRAFGSKVYDDLVGGRFFITSERDRGTSYGAAWGGQRRYSIREAKADGSVNAVSEFGEYSSLRSARTALAKMEASDL